MGGGGGSRDRQAIVKKSRGEKDTETVSVGKKMEKNGRIYCYFCQLCRTAEKAGTAGTGGDTQSLPHT